MTTAQLQFQFDLPEQTPRELRNKLSERSRNSPLSVRELTSNDQVEALLNLAKHFAEETGHEGEYDELMTRVSIGSMLNNTKKQFSNCFIAYKYDLAIGFLLASCTHSLYADRITAYQDLWYVLPQHRGGLVALMLLDRLEEWARERHASVLFTGTVNERLAEKTGNILTKLGHTRVGSMHAKELTYG